MGIGGNLLDTSAAQAERLGNLSHALCKALFPFVVKKINMSLVMALLQVIMERTIRWRTE